VCVCGECSHDKMPLPELEYAKPVRVCSNCVQNMQAMEASGARSPSPSFWE